MRIVIAIDSFKGCLTSAEANTAAATGIQSVVPSADLVQVAVSDGGEGFVAAAHVLIGGRLVQVTVSDPLLRPVVATYLLDGSTAVIEMAQANGLTLLKPHERNPELTTSYGTGQIVADAIRHGARQVVVGLGGSATSDAGTGMLHALIDAFSPGKPSGSCLQADASNPGALFRYWADVASTLQPVSFTIATDVSNPLCGPQGAAHVFAPQKSSLEAGEEQQLMVERLEQRTQCFAQTSARYFGYDYSMRAGAGAAGGLGYAFMQYLHAECLPGVQWLLGQRGFSVLARQADLIITGEGAADRQTLMGKLPKGILTLAGNTPVCLIAGRVSDRDQLLQAGFARVECIHPPGTLHDEGMRKEVAQRNISTLCGRIVSEMTKKTR